MAAFNTEWAYTVDGGGVGELECENFNAASVKILGNSVHPGSAKGVMVNALSLATRIHPGAASLEAPKTTELRGFYHLSSIKGGVGKRKCISCATRGV